MSLLSQYIHLSINNNNLSIAKQDTKKSNHKTETRINLLNKQLIKTKLPNTKSRLNNNVNVIGNSIETLLSNPKYENILQSMLLYKEFVKNYFNTIFSSYPKEKSKWKDIIDTVNFKNGKDKLHNIGDKFIIFKIKSNYTVELLLLNKKLLETDNRFYQFLNMFQHTLNYCKDNKLYIPDTYLVCFIADRFPFEFEQKNIKFPVFVLSTTITRKYPLLPDNTFQEFSFTKRFDRNKNYNWDKQKILIEDNMSDISSDKIYFKGADTTSLNSHVRKLFVENQHKDHMNVDLLNNSSKYEPFYTFSKHKYLLSLPGRFDWSNRFTKLFLLQRPVFNYKNTNKDYPKDGKTIAFDSLIFRPNIDYFEIIDGVTTNKNENKPMVKKAIDQFVNKKKELDKSKSKYKQAYISGYNKAKKLSMDHIYIYLYYAILFNAKHVPNNLFV
jgi:hypothetical protein